MLGANFHFISVDKLNIRLMTFSCLTFCTPFFSIHAQSFFSISSKKIIYNQNLCLHATDLFRIRQTYYHIINLSGKKNKLCHRPNKFKSMSQPTVVFILRPLFFMEWMHGKHRVFQKLIKRTAESFSCKLVH